MKILFGIVVIVIVIVLGLAFSAQDNLNVEKDMNDMFSGYTDFVLPIDKIEIHGNSVRVIGDFGDELSVFGEIEQNREGNKIFIIVNGKKPVQKLKPSLRMFSEDIPIETSGLEVGKYEIDVNGLKAEFEFTGVEDLPELE